MIVVATIATHSKTIATILIYFFIVFASFSPILLLVDIAAASGSTTAAIFLSAKILAAKNNAAKMPITIKNVTPAPGEATHFPAPAIAHTDKMNDNAIIAPSK